MRATKVKVRERHDFVFVVFVPLRDEKKSKHC